MTDRAEIIEKGLAALITEINQAVGDIPPGPERTKKVREVVSKRLAWANSEWERGFWVEVLHNLNA